MGRLYTLICDSNKNESSNKKDCAKQIKIESLGRSIWLLLISLAIFLIDPFRGEDNYHYHKYINDIKFWILYILITVIPAISIAIRIKRIYNRFKFPKIKSILNYSS